MVRETLSKIFSSRVFYIVFSLLVSIALWMFYEIQENQIQYHRVSEIPVVRQNEEVLGDRNLLISSISPENVTITFRCPRSMVSKLRKDTLSAVIDLQNITSRGYKTLRYDIAYPSGIEREMISVESRPVDQISLFIDWIFSNQVRVAAPYTGGAAEGFLTDPVEITPPRITVSGPEEVVLRVNEARVSIVRENLTTTFTENMPFILYDVDGNELSEDILNKLTISEDTVHINIPVREIKDIPLEVDFIYGAGATTQNTIYELNPTYITIVGDPEAVRDINSINIGTVDLTSREYSDTFSFPIRLPNNVTNMSGETEASGYYEIRGLSMKYLSIPNTRVHLLNEPAGYVTEVRSQSIDVRIRCRPENYEYITEANIRIVADLKDLGPGPQRVSARVSVDGFENAGAIGTYMVYIAILRDI